jgi:hypothetical protein
MAVKNHCDLCDVVIAGEGTQVEVIVSGLGAALHGRLSVSVEGRPGMICPACITDLQNRHPAYVFKPVEKVEKVEQDTRLEEAKLIDQWIDQVKAELGVNLTVDVVAAIRRLKKAAL